MMNESTNKHSAHPKKPLRIINSLAPIRICDNGGWTDTWFAEYGEIFNIGVYPYAETQIEVYGKDDLESRVIIYAENYGQRYAMTNDNPGYDQHPLLEAAIDYMGISSDISFQVTIFSEAPVGASTGTSAAVTVSLIGALDALTPGRMTPHEVAATAHSIEVDMLKQQCGIQDQLCSAYGGINYIQMFKYPRAIVSQIHIPNSIWWELERRLVLIYLGKSHISSDVHKKVITDLQNAGPENIKLQDLRKTAKQSCNSLYEGDFNQLGRAMIDNTDAQGRLNAALISTEAARIIEIAKEYGAIGWKVNGAGGGGGSITILTQGIAHKKRAMVQAIEQENPLFREIPIYLSRFGLRVWDREM